MKLESVRTRAQIEAVASLAREVWSKHYIPIVGRGQVDYMLDRFQSAPAITRQIESEGYEYYLVPDSGYLALVPDAAAGRMMISKIYVREERRGAGLGRDMIGFAEARAAELGCRELWLTVNKDNAGSIAFYERRGFRKTGPLVADIGGGYVMDDWRMAKAVEPAAAARG